MRSTNWGWPHDYLTGQNIKRPCDRCMKKMGDIGGCYARMYDRQLCFGCFDELFPRRHSLKELKEKAGWDS